MTKDVSFDPAFGNTDLERLELMTPEEREEYKEARRLVKLMGPEPTRETILAALLPGLKDMFGDVYEDYKPELEAIYGGDFIAANRELEEDK